MARIRTIKPEFWTDEIIVQLPFQARLLFIGIWNFADDHGAIEESTDRLRMQIFPAEPSLDMAELIDLLVAATLLERFVDDEGKRVIQVRNWHKHQKVDNPAKSRILGEKYRKLAIPSEARRAVALKYGCTPGGTKEVACYFCGTPGRIHWWNLSSGRPSSWVVFDLELDHLEPEVNGGSKSAENLVLSCRSCNRGRRDKAALPWIVSRVLASPSESSPSEGKGREKDIGGADAPLSVAGLESSGKENGKDPPPPKVRRASRVPEDFRPDLDYARAHLPDVDAEREAQKFRDWEFKTPRKDWEAVWRTWISNCRDNGKYARATTPGGSDRGLPRLNFG